MRGLLRALGIFAFVLIAAVAVAACGGGGSSSSSSSSAENSSGGETEESSGGETEESAESGSGGEISIDVGTHTLKFPAGTTPKIAMFASSGAAYQEVARESAEKAAKEKGYDFTFYDGKFDATTQLNQLQTALSGGEYNAWIIEGDAGKIICSTVKQASEKVVIVQTTNYTCEQAGKPAGEESWTPGTLTSVGGSTTITYYEAFAKKVAESIPANAQVGFINGPATITSTEELKEALNNNGIEPVAEVNTNYLTPEGLKETETMLQAHSDINVIITIYSDLTVGVVRAIESAGKEGEIEVYDLGGSSANVKLIEEGKQSMSAPYFPASVSETAVEAISNAFAGKPVEKFYSGFSLGTPEEPFFITKETVSKYEPQY
jgi:ribose transport system substrate-binding protein